jgi:hypothetical protein
LGKQKEIKTVNATVSNQLQAIKLELKLWDNNKLKLFPVKINQAILHTHFQKKKIHSIKLMMLEIELIIIKMKINFMQMMMMELREKHLINWSTMLILEIEIIVMWNIVIYLMEMNALYLHGINHKDQVKLIKKKL